MKPMILTISIGWLITRYCDSQNTYYSIDVLTVHFIVLQFIYLLCKWEDLELEWPFFILQQASCCISTCIEAFLFHDILLRYLPFQFKHYFIMDMVFVRHVSRIDNRFYSAIVRRELARLLP
jgi:hypothetical protein